LNELRQFNPEMLDKQRVLAVTKCDVLDAELIEMLEPSLPDIPHVFISSIAQMGLVELKDILWAELNKESNKLSTSIETTGLLHRPKEIKALAAELAAEGEDEDFSFEYEETDEEEDDLEEYDDFEYDDDEGSKD